jgi:biopolymer transport protein ExbD
VRLQRKGNLKKARIEIIPMIDTIFFLLVFFMISTLSMSQFTGVQVNLPKAASGSQPPTETVVISRTKEGQLFFNKTEVSRESLLQSLTAELAKNPELLVVINADDGVQHGNVVEIMDQARQIGVTRLSIAVKPRETKE